MVVNLTQNQPTQQSGTYNNTNESFTNPALDSMRDLYGNISPFTNAGFTAGQAVASPLTGASTQVRATLGQVGLGVNDLLNTGVNKTLEQTGTSLGAGVNNLAIGAIPGFVILLGVVLAFTLLKKV